LPYSVAVFEAARIVNGLLSHVTDNLDFERLIGHFYWNRRKN